jgi:hypothetical protein
MRPLQLTPLSQAARAVRHGRYRTTKEVRWRTRAQMILGAAAHGRSAPALAPSVQAPEPTVRTWVTR